MPAIVILATNEDSLAEAWERQLLPGRIALRLGAENLLSGQEIGFTAVLVLDSAFSPKLPSSVSRCPTVYVGEPKSLPFEQARMAGLAKAYLSYAESTHRLRDLLPIFEELAEKQSILEMFQARALRAETRSEPVRIPATEILELWDFLECAVECIDDKDRLVAEFRRASRKLLKASHAILFLRGPDGFRADHGTAFFALDDPLVSCFESQPAVVDGNNWAASIDPIAELAVRNRLALWAARILVPIHDNGRLLGLIALGVRDDGRSYDDADKKRAILLARLLRKFLSKAADFMRFSLSTEKATLGARYLPGTLILSPDETAPRHVPLVVRDLIGQVRHSNDLCKVYPASDQPFRAQAGIIAETGGVWAFWQESSEDLQLSEKRERDCRREMLRELALTLSHEFSNSLVSLSIFRQSNGDRPLPATLIETMKVNIAQLEALNNNLSVMQRMHEVEALLFDFREVIQRIGMNLGIASEYGPDPVLIHGSESLLEYALNAFMGVIIENRGGRMSAGLVLKLRSTGSHDRAVALISLRGSGIELEGVLPAASAGGAPSLGRLSVLLSKEIISLHSGEIHSGPGMEGTEILISVRGL